MPETCKVKSEKSQCKYRLKKINSLLHELEYSIVESRQSDRQILMAIRLENLKGQNTTTQLKELQEENKQLLNMLQLRHDEHSMSRTSSDLSCSTMSMVHLQYKYEELLANQNGLLKTLEMKISAVRKYQEENANLKEEIETLKMSMQNYEEEITRLSEKNRILKWKKDNKIARLKSERDTLAIVHNRLVTLLHNQCMEREDLLNDQIQQTTESDRALLLQEIRKNNILSYENFQLQQENEYLQSVLKVKRHKSDEIVVSETKIIK